MDDLCTLALPYDPSIVIELPDLQELQELFQDEEIQKAEVTQHTEVNQPNLPRKETKDKATLTPKSFSFPQPPKPNEYKRLQILNACLLQDFLLFTSYFRAAVLV